MALLARLLWRFLYFCALLFVSLSVAYTTEILLFSVAKSKQFGTLSNSGSSLGTTSDAGLGLKRTISERQQVFRRDNTSQLVLPIGLANRASPAPTFGWLSSEFTFKHELGHPGANMVDERTVLSKAFASSMRPSNVLPYFYRASGSFDKDDITITTLVTSNRFEVLARLVKKYKGLPWLHLLIVAIISHR